MRIPAKLAFSAKYRLYGICGAFGLLDHGCESDMAQRGIFSEGRTGLWVKEREGSEIEEEGWSRLRVISRPRGEAALNGTLNVMGD